MKTHIVATIDGYASSGKSTLARELAKHFSWVHIDSGAMYRAVTLFGIQNFFDSTLQQINSSELIVHLNFIQLEFHVNKISKYNEIYLNDVNVTTEIRSFLVNQLVSQVAQLSPVRKFLVKQKQNLAIKQSIVMDGRDIGTVVFPNADFKFFITASIEERAKRRFLEISPTQLSKEQIKKNLIERDLNDTKRKDSPLIKASDALLIDNSGLNQQQTLQIIISYINNNKNNF